MTAMLSVDTSGPFCSVALRDSRGAVFQACSSGAGDHFEKLPQLVRNLLGESGVAIFELAEIRIGIGPGSFTGLRIGMSFCKGLAWALRCPVVPFCSFEAVACAVVHRSSNGRAEVGLPMSVVIASDARREELFCAEYDFDPTVKQLTVVRGPHIVNTLEFCDRHFQGGGEDRHKHLVTPMRELSVGGKHLESITQIASGGFQVLTQDSRSLVSELASLEPNYLRQVAAKTIEERRLGG